MEKRLGLPRSVAVVRCVLSMAQSDPPYSEVEGEFGVKSPAVVQLYFVGEYVRTSPHLSTGAASHTQFEPLLHPSSSNTPDAKLKLSILQKCSPEYPVWLSRFPSIQS